MERVSSELLPLRVLSVLNGKFAVDDSQTEPMKVDDSRGGGIRRLVIVLISSKLLVK